MPGKQQQEGDRAPRGKAEGAFLTIGEVADMLGVQQHVLRFWETKFSHIRPLKRGGGRRYYRPEDVALLKTIHKLLYGEGYTIRGVQKMLREQGKGQVVRSHKSRAAAPAASNQNGLSDRQRKILKTMLEELRDLRSMLA